MSTVQGRYYDGESSVPHEVTLNLDGARQVTVSGLASPLTLPLEALRLSPRLGNTTRSLAFPNGAKCETLDNDTIDQWQALTGKARGLALVHRLESAWRWVAVALAVTVLFVIVSFKWGIPLVARGVAMNLPPDMAYDLGRGTLATLDRTLFKKSTLTEARKAQLRERFYAIGQDYQALPLKLEFRAAGMPNAFALPNGTVVVTDELVKLTQRDEQIMAVLMHEIGHVHHRHTLRMALESSAAGLIAMAIFGDATLIAELLGALPAIYANAEYSRGHETEADTFALEYMRERGIPKHHFADALKLLTQESGATKGTEGPLRYLSSHPPTDERIRRFE